MPRSSGLLRNTSVALSATFLKNSWAAISINLSKRTDDCPPWWCLLGTSESKCLSTWILLPESSPSVASDLSMVIRP